MTNRVRKNIGFLAPLFLTACMAASAQEPRLTPKVEAAHPVLPIGSAAPDFALPGVDGKIHKLSDYKDSPYLMVMFICNHCPTSSSWWPITRIKAWPPWRFSPTTRPRFDSRNWATRT